MAILVEGECVNMTAIKKLVKRTARKLGLEIGRAPKFDGKIESEEYGRVAPSATYSPWNKDRSFNQMYRAIQEFTLVDKYRCYELWTLVEQSSKLHEGAIVEIGVWRGGTGALIARQSERCGIIDSVYLCDTFAGVVKAGGVDANYKGGEHSDASRQIVEELVFDQMKLTNVKILEGVFPDQTGPEIGKLRFRFCHIDVDVYQSAKDIGDWIWDRMVPNGIIVYDDYGFANCKGIAQYVDEQMAIRDRLVFHNLNGHAVVIKI